MYKLIEGKFFETKEIPMEDILDMLNSTSQYDCAKKSKLELEDYNFKVDSSKWKTIKTDIGKVKINKEKDITEFEGEQLFTFDAMIRETKKAGKKVPTDKQWNKINKEDINNLVYGGRRSTDGVTFHLRGYYAYLWSSSPSGTAAYYRYFHWDNTGVHRYLYDKLYGFSVRCLK